MIERTAIRTAAVSVAALATTTVAQAEGELNLYNWGDYINPAVLTAFTEETGIEVNLDTYGSNEEMLAKIQAGASGYDIVFPSVHMHDIMYQLGLLAKTDIGQSENFSNIDPQFIRAETDPNAEYCLPYAWGNVGVVYNKTKVEEMSSWADLFDLAASGEKIVLLDDPRETIGIGHIMNGTSVNSTDEAEVVAAADVIKENLENVSAFSYDSIPLVTSGDVAAAHWYVGANIFVQQNPDVLAYYIPSEGATMYQEDMCVLKDAPNADNAKAFMEFYLRPEIAALNVEQQMNGTPNIPAQELIPDEIAENKSIYPDAETLEKLQIFVDLGQDLRLYNREWTAIKTAQ
ncbi:Spermidine/putrescine-binding periplasmic protein precursor [Roseovarius sp. THAF27]|uniref:ABC transporter substrate-binding protein n=1 Tax=unclassified Roseovarius TaxID=2614913 RepID=UPI0012680C8A|nr:MULTISPECIES: spermidine/putrescine ABC transporter substrate-binding protein [unclassified Roseovarius]QFT82356.1 Spermidine/putrescine-binding periplasmic protein precursor [Roseovarius sp. THAF27]QFT98611.1 Spermidine/putrescine-binding periplasmic protein precursor [Roseovarius sp. THAF8]